MFETNCIDPKAARSDCQGGNTKMIKEKTKILSSRKVNIAANALILCRNQKIMYQLRRCTRRITISTKPTQW